MLPTVTEGILALSGYLIFWILKIIKVKSEKKNDFNFTRFIQDELLYMFIGVLSIYPVMVMYPEVTGIVTTPNVVAFNAGFAGASLLRTLTAITENFATPKKS